MLTNSLYTFFFVNYERHVKVPNSNCGHNVVFCPCSVNFEDLLLAPFRILAYLDFIIMQLMSLFIPDNILCSGVDFT